MQAAVPTVDEQLNRDKLISISNTGHPKKARVHGGSSAVQVVRIGLPGTPGRLRWVWPHRLFSSRGPSSSLTLFNLLQAGLHPSWRSKSWMLRNAFILLVHARFRDRPSVARNVLPPQRDLGREAVLEYVHVSILGARRCTDRGLDTILDRHLGGQGGSLVGARKWATFHKGSCVVSVGEAGVWVVLIAHGGLS